MDRLVVDGLSNEVASAFNASDESGVAVMTDRNDVAHSQPTLTLRTTQRVGSGDLHNSSNGGKMAAAASGTVANAESFGLVAISKSEAAAMARTWRIGKVAIVGASARGVRRGAFRSVAFALGRVTLGVAFLRVGLVPFLVDLFFIVSLLLLLDGGAASIG